MLRGRIPTIRVGKRDLDPNFLDVNYVTLSALADGDAVYINASGYTGPAQANASATMHAIGVSVGAVPSGVTGPVRVRGEYVSSNYDFSGFIGRLAYVSAATAGGLATIGPSSSGQIIQQVGYMTARRTLMVSIGGAYQRGGALQ